MTTACWAAAGAKYALMDGNVIQFKITPTVQSTSALYLRTRSNKHRTEGCRDLGELSGFAATPLGEANRVQLGTSRQIPSPSTARVSHPIPKKAPKAWMMQEPPTLSQAPST
eukprot:766154-Hanusia_phi.AAC.8